MLLAQSLVELLSLQLRRRLLADRAEERRLLAAVGGLEKDGKGCWTLCLVEVVRCLPLYTGLERAQTSQSHSVTNTPFGPYVLPSKCKEKENPARCCIFWAELSPVGSAAVMAPARLCRYRDITTTIVCLRWGYSSLGRVLA